MINPSVSVTINGITDAELAEILEIKANNPNVLTFNPQQLGVQHYQPQGQQPSTVYSNAVLSGSGEAGIRIVQDILSFLLKKDEKAQAQGQ